MQSLEHPSDMDQDVIQVDYDEDVGHVMEDVVHEMLECRWGVGHSEGHNEVLKRPVARVERGLPLMSGQDPNVVVSAMDWP